jgi:hypothetical protein
MYFATSVASSENVIPLQTKGFLIYLVQTSQNVKNIRRGVYYHWFKSQIKTIAQISKMFQAQHYVH